MKRGALVFIFVILLILPLASAFSPQDLKNSIHSFFNKLKITGKPTYDSFTLERACSGTVVNSQMNWAGGTEADCLVYCKTITGAICCQINVGSNYINCYARMGEIFYYANTNVKATLIDSASSTTTTTTPPPNYIYSWYSGSFGTCSVTCGGGTQTRIVYCQRNDNTQVADSYCTETKPITSQSCNTKACTTNNIIPSTTSSSFTPSQQCSGSVVNSQMNWAGGTEADCLVYCKTITGATCCQVNVGSNYINCYARMGEISYYANTNVKATLISTTSIITPAQTPINGQCGTSNTQTLATAPTKNLCNAGSVTSVITTASGWSWSCDGSNGGTTSSCVATKYVAPVTLNCTAGTCSGDNICKNNQWIIHCGNGICDCNEINSTCSADCLSASKPAQKVAVTQTQTSIEFCGNANGQIYSSLSSSSTELCSSSGILNSFSETTDGWNWQCHSPGTALTSICSATKKVQTETSIVPLCMQQGSICTSIGMSCKEIGMESAGDKNLDLSCNKNGLSSCCKINTIATTRDYPCVNPISGPVSEGILKGAKEYVYPSEINSWTYDFENDAIKSLDLKPCMWKCDYDYIKDPNRNQCIKTVESGWLCQDGFNKIYRNIDGSLKDSTFCKNGCTNGECAKDSTCVELNEGTNNVKENRINVIFVGFNFNNIDEVKDIANTYQNQLLSYEPFTSNQDKFNFWYINELPKVENPATGEDTWGNEMTNSKLFELSSSCLVQNKQLIGIGNWQFRSNSAGENTMKVSAPDQDEIKQIVFTHEFGHSFGNLYDEYNLGGYGFGSISIISNTILDKNLNCDSYDKISGNPCSKWCSSVKTVEEVENLPCTGIDRNSCHKNGKYCMWIYDCPNDKDCKPNYPNLDYPDTITEKGCVNRIKLCREYKTGATCNNVLDGYWSGSFCEWNDIGIGENNKKMYVPQDKIDDYVNIKYQFGDETIKVKFIEESDVDTSKWPIYIIKPKFIIEQNSIKKEMIISSEYVTSFNEKFELKVITPPTYSVKAYGIIYVNLMIKKGSEEQTKEIPLEQSFLNAISTGQEDWGDPNSWYKSKCIPTGSTLTYYNIGTGCLEGTGCYERCGVYNHYRATLCSIMGDNKASLTFVGETLRNQNILNECSETFNIIQQKILCNQLKQTTGSAGGICSNIQ